MKSFFKIGVLLVGLTVAGLTVLSAQTREELQKRKQEIERELDDLTRQYNATKNSTKASLKQLALIKKKINAREALVNGINREVRQLDETIYLNERDIYRLRRELDTLKAKYAKSIQFAYKNRSSYEYVNFLFSAGNFNDAIKRMAYLRSYRANRETQALAITKSQQLLAEKVQVLSANKKDRLNTLEIQNKQLLVLQEDKKEQDLVVKELKGKEKELNAQIKDKEKQRAKVLLAVNAVIRREIEEAKKREEAKRLKAQEDARKAAAVAARNNANGNNPSGNNNAATKNNAAGTTAVGNAGNNAAANNNLANAKRGDDSPVNTGLTTAPKDRTYSPLESTPEGMELSLNFEANKGKLPWPVSNGIVTVVFGTQSIAGTKLMQKSDGIEIAVPVGSAVRCVAEGEVIYVGEIADEQIVMVKHGKYFTGYKNLSSVAVSNNQKVKAGSVLGKSGTSIDGEGSILFMIMNDRSVPQNPTPWLKAK